MIATEQQIENLTAHVKQFTSSWTNSDSSEVFNTNAGEFNETIVGDGGILVSIKRMGSTVLVNGIDITGNLGTTVQIKDSNINVGGQNVNQSITPMNVDSSFMSNPWIIGIGTSLVVAFIIWGIHVGRKKLRIKI